MAKWQVSEVQKHLKGAEYPMSGDELAKLADQNGAENDGAAGGLGLNGR